MKIAEQVIIDLKLWICENLEEHITIDVISERAGYSKWYLQRMFRKMTGISLARYVREARLRHAAHDLETSSYTVSEIAFRYGFLNQQAFTRVFKRHFLLPPGKWRSEHRR
ncbi:helix-turn-helix domain-containing protein [Pantoea stewartii]|uniref:helix-turn-helix domain-containing protein n=1 Tax=Pantoea stewartii TaxID=66269 RepID=UPI001981C706|nr:helix-turn-helix domain-containing protein [Pantoea stewartii]